MTQQAQATVTETQLYVPDYVKPVDKSNSTFRIGIQGPSGSGKSTSAATFPNPIFMNFDNRIKHLADKVTQIPFYDAEFVKAFLSKVGISKHYVQSSGGSLSSVVNIRNAVIKFLELEAPKFTPKQTLVFDSWTTFQDGLDAVIEAGGPYYTKKMEENPFEFWAQKKDASERISKLLTELKCNVVVLFHELQQRDPKDGRLLDKIQPLMQGGFTPKIKLYYDYFFRQKLSRNAEDVIVTTWQTQGDNEFDSQSLNTNLPKIVPATYESLIKEYP